MALVRFTELFNAGRYWDSHEVLEEPWRANGSDFYHGLILFASAFVHAQRGNPHGVRAQLEKAERYLGGYRPAYLGVDVEGLLRHAADTREKAARGDTVDYPSLILSPRRIRGDETEVETSHPSE